MLTLSRGSAAVRSRWDNEALVAAILEKKCLVEEEYKGFKDLDNRIIDQEGRTGQLEINVDERRRMPKAEDKLQEVLFKREAIPHFIDTL